MENTLVEFKKHVLYEIMLNNEDDCGFTYGFNDSEVPFFEEGIMLLNYVRFTFMQRVFGKQEIVIPTKGNESFIIDLNQDDCFKIQLASSDVIVTHDVDVTIGVVSSEEYELYTEDELREHLDEVYRLFKIIHECYVSSIDEAINLKLKETLCQTIVNK